MKKKIIGIFIAGLFIGTSIIPGFGQDIKKNLSDITMFSLNSSTPIGNIFDNSSNRTTIIPKKLSDQTYLDLPWIKYNDGYTENAIGHTNSGTIYICEAIQLTDTELSESRGGCLFRIRVSIGCDEYGPEPAILYQVWAQDTQPADPTTANIVGEGISTNDVWETIYLDSYTIPLWGDVWVGVTYTCPAGKYPMGIDETTISPTRGGYYWNSVGGWTTLSDQGYPGVWGLDVQIISCGVPNPPYIPSNPTPSNHAAYVDIYADLSWTGGDPDGDTVYYDVYFEAWDSTPNVLVSHYQLYDWYDPGTMLTNTTYYWQIIATDEHADTSTGPIWDFTTGIGGNNPPNTPTYLYPSNHNTDVDINASLAWTCSDPNGDELTYDVYFGTSSNPPLVSQGQSQKYYHPPETMSYNIQYYWKIVAEDEHSAKTTGPIWDFTTNSDVNNPPNKPSNPYPKNGSINIATNIILNWMGGDPDVDDTVTYDVYFGGMLPIQKITSNISNTSINPGNLVNGLTYFWNVIAWDNHNASTVGPSWHFTTINPDNRPPNKPSKPSGETKGKIGQNYTYEVSTTDPEADQLYYNWSWGDGTYSGWIGPYNNGVTVNQSHRWADKENYQIKVMAKDIFGLESDWSDPLSIRMPKTYIYNPILQLLIKMLEHIPFFEKILNQYNI